MNKRAQVEVGATPINFYSVIVFVIVMVIFFAIFAWQKGGVSGEMTGESLIEVEANTALLNFLRMPIEFEGQKMTVTDLIVLSKDHVDSKCRYGNSGNKYCDKLKGEANKIFNQQFAKEAHWSILIQYDSPDKKIVLGRGQTNKLKVRSSLFLPTINLNPGILVQIQI